VWNVLTVWSPQAWPLARSAWVQTTGFQSGSRIRYGEERQALLGPGREQLDVAEVRDVAEARKGRSGHRRMIVLL